MATMSLSWSQCGHFLLQAIEALCPRALLTNTLAALYGLMSNYSFSGRFRFQGIPQCRVSGTRLMAKGRLEVQGFVLPTRSWGGRFRV